jgi:hypothetical protein
MSTIMVLVIGGRELRGRDHSEDLGVEWRIILDWILWK